MFKLKFKVFNRIVCNDGTHPGSLVVHGKCMAQMLFVHDVLKDEIRPLVKSLKTIFEKILQIKITTLL